MLCGIKEFGPGTGTGTGAFTAGDGVTCKGSGDVNCRVDDDFVGVEGNKPPDKSYSVFRDDLGAMLPVEGALGIPFDAAAFFARLRGGDLFTGCVRTISASAFREDDRHTDSELYVATLRTPSCCNGCSQRISSSCSETSGTRGYNWELVSLLREDRPEGLWRGLTGAALGQNSSGMDSSDRLEEFAERDVCLDFSPVTEE
jgi:hypothetical protein